jgi:hypothetical protein
MNKDTCMGMCEAEYITLAPKKAIHKRGICVKKMCNVLPPEFEFGRVPLCDCVSSFCAYSSDTVEISKNIAYDPCKSMG